MSARVISLFSLSAAILLVCLAPHVSFAQTTTNCNAPTTGDFIPLACYAGSPQFSAVFSSSNSLPQYFNNIFKIALSIGAILAVLRIAYAGYMYMGSADMWGNKQQAKEILGDAIIGLLLLFAIFLIFNQINPNLLNLDVLKNIQPVPTITPTTCQSANCTGVNG